MDFYTKGMSRMDTHTFNGINWVGIRKYFVHENNVYVQFAIPYSLLHCDIQM